MQKRRLKNWNPILPEIKESLLTKKKIVFMFPSRVSSMLKMCYGLYSESEIEQFRAYADHCFELQREYSCEAKTLD